MMRHPSLQCVVLVLSCDRYRDLWEPGTKLFSRYWPDCPWPKYLASDSKPALFTDFKSIGGSRPGLDWSSLTRDVLNQIEAGIILLFLDDFFLTEPADTALAVTLLEEMDRTGAAHVRLIPHAQYTDEMKGSKLVTEHLPGLPYRACLQAGFWRRSVLLSLLEDGESPWEFEVKASHRSELLAEPFLAVIRNPVPYVDVLERGKWLPRGVKLCQREGLAIDFAVRPPISLSDKFRRLRIALLSHAIALVPKTLRVAIRRHRLQAAGSTS